MGGLRLSLKFLGVLRVWIGEVTFWVCYSEFQVAFMHTQKPCSDGTIELNHILPITLSWLLCILAFSLTSNLKYTVSTSRLIVTIKCIISGISEPSKRALSYGLN
jgi:hypothetical protein